MKINGVNHSNVNPYKKKLNDQPLKEVKQKLDHIEISSEAKELQKNSKFSVERQEKLEALKQKIDSGEYNVNADKVANKFYDFWLK